MAYTPQSEYQVATQDLPQKDPYQPSSGIHSLIIELKPACMFQIIGGGITTDGLPGKDEIRSNVGPATMTYFTLC